MAIKYYKLFDLMNRRGIRKTDLREILSPKTVAKLSKGEYVSGEVIEKLCLYLKCQPGDIMEVVYDESKLSDDEVIYKADYINTESEFEQIDTVTYQKDLNIDDDDEEISHSRSAIEVETKQL
ncbi:helix-turn-helix domain-containing protein [Diplocloster agilis]|uniref:helix-turn-helix domain-containing protein n=1 Tax=Diplocloster agilis TaxID=2850323 RepID=UPI0008230AE2|nr:helix-turn-helix transcriptional regulator [Suonthocola fibrivorans]MCU6737059.1 helix-turn-helix domain-containing protein [Suonthocola fibrivorans]SCJ95633.1 Predicted transcriptional regulator [uncultured Clostridium sp.]